MTTARVYNDNVHPYTEVFKGSRVEIPAGGFAATVIPPPKNRPLPTVIWTDRTRQRASPIRISARNGRICHMTFAVVNK